MPPKGSGRGRGGRKAASTPRSNRIQKLSFGRTNGRSLNYQNYDVDGIHLVWEEWPYKFVIAGLLPEDYPKPRRNQSDGESDYGSGIIPKSTPRKAQRVIKDDDDDADDDDLANESEDGDWTETDVEVYVAAKTRGFYRPPPRREVVRQRVRRSESSRYNKNIPKVKPESDHEDNVENGNEEQQLAPSTRSSQNSNSNSNQQNEDLPVIVEQEATDDEAEGETESKENAAPARRRGGRRKKSPTPEVPKPEIVDEGELSDSNFPEPYLERKPPLPLKQCEDKADFIMQKKFDPMNDPAAFIKALTKLDPATRSTEVLYEIALNAQMAIKAWQDEYLELDLITAPKSNPPKKPLTGGRLLLEPAIYDDMLEADLYGYTYDSRKAPGTQDPFRQQAGGGKFVGGRELRQRRGRDVGAVDLSEPEIDENEGYGTRRRRAVQLQRLQGNNGNQLEVPARRGVKRMNSNNTISDYDGPPRKRGRPSAAERNAMQSRVQQLREESLAVSGTSEMEGQSPEPSNRRRGRPPGSKNTMPRSDAGVKKGPRKKNLDNADSEDMSMSGIVETPASGVDSMDIDELDALNGTHLAPDAVTNGQPATESVDRASASTDATGNADSKDPKKRVRSEKRSKSMTEWWAARKAKAAEDRKAQLAAQAEADRIAEEQARAAHAAQQARYGVSTGAPESRYWPQIAQAPQHTHGFGFGSHSGRFGEPVAGTSAYPGPPPRVPHVAFTGPQPSKDRERIGSGISLLRDPPPAPPAPPTHTASHPAHQAFREPLFPYLHAREPPPAPKQYEPIQIPPPPPPAGHARIPSLGAPRPPSAHRQTPLPPPQHPPQPAPPASRPEPPRQEPPSRTLAGPLDLGPRDHGPRDIGGTRDPGPREIGGPRSLGEPRPLLAYAPPPYGSRPPSISFGGSPPQQNPQQHVFHHHPAPPPPPSNPLQFSPPPQQHSLGRQPSPLRRIINYVSDPSKAAQPAGPPYQTIMTPGANSPTIIQHPSQGLSRPGSRGRTPPASTAAPPTASAPPASAGSFMSAFHINNTTGRPPIPGTGSFRPDTPGKSTFTHYTVYTPPGLASRGSIASGSSATPGPAPQGPQGRMTGAQVQDLALAAVQPVARKPLEDVLKEQRERDRDFTSRWTKLQPAPSEQPSNAEQERRPPTATGQDGQAAGPPTLPPMTNAGSPPAESYRPRFW